jgi:hypothetical protein
MHAYRIDRLAMAVKIARYVDGGALQLVTAVVFEATKTPREAKIPRMAMHIESMPASGPRRRNADCHGLSGDPSDECSGSGIEVVSTSTWCFWCGVFSTNSMLDEVVDAGESIPPMEVTSCLVSCGRPESEEELVEAILYPILARYANDL